MYIYRDFPLNEILYYKIGGEADFVLKIENKQDLLDAFEFVKKNRIKKVLPVGLGSNLLINDNGFNGVVLWFSGSDKTSIIQKDENTIEAFSSVILDDLIQFSF